MNFEEIKIFLPQYLGSADLHTLFQDLKEFPDNLWKMYTHSLKDSPTLYQGDGISEFGALLEPKNEKDFYAIILSNTCDMSPDNRRKIPARALYVPLLKLTKLKEMLFNQFPHQTVESFISDIRSQRVTQALYLPKGFGFPDEFVAFLDCISNIDAAKVYATHIPNKRLFTLSNYGFYILLLKLSMHFTRIREGVNRGNMEAEPLLN